MKAKKKSNQINYTHLYQILALTCLLPMLYFTINFLLPLANIVSIFSLFLSLFCLGWYTLIKRHTYFLACSFLFIILSLGTIIVSFIQ